MENIWTGNKIKECLWCVPRKNKGNVENKEIRKKKLPFVCFLKSVGQFPRKEKKETRKTRK